VEHARANLVPLALGVALLAAGIEAFTRRDLCGWAV
jgi:MprA protease rhombosortase-interaction domain-containing protein